MNSKKVKLASATVGAGAVVAMGSLTVALGSEDSGLGDGRVRAGDDAGRDQHHREGGELARNVGSGSRGDGRGA